MMDWRERDKMMIQRVKEMFPKGTRIEMVHMEDPYNPIPKGTRGTVKFVDDIGTVFASWDNGSGLGVIYGEDGFRKLTEEELLEEQEESQGMDMSM